MSPRDCDHGRQMGKCADCDVLKLERINTQLLEALKDAFAVWLNEVDCEEYSQTEAKIRAAIAAAKG